MNVYNHLRRVGRREQNGKTKAQKMRKPTNRCTVHPTLSGKDTDRFFQLLPTTQLIIVETKAPPWNASHTVNQMGPEGKQERLTDDGYP